MILLRSYCLFNLEEVITVLKMNTSKVTFGVAADSLLCFLHSAVMMHLRKIRFCYKFCFLIVYLSVDVHILLYGA